MKIFIVSLIGLTLAGCASSPKVQPAMPTFAEQAASGADVDSGWYAKQNRENVYVDVQNPRQQSEEAQKKAFEAQREADYKQRQIDQLQYENQLLRVRGNYTLEKQVNEVQGFDNQNNPVIKQKTVNPEPQQRPEVQRYVDPTVHPTPAPQHPRQPWQTGEYDTYNESRPAYTPPARAVPAPPAAPVESASAPVAQAPAVPSTPAPPAAQAARAPASLAPDTTPVQPAPLVSELPAPITQ